MPPAAAAAAAAWKSLAGGAAVVAAFAVVVAAAAAAAAAVAVAVVIVVAAVGAVCGALRLLGVVAVGASITCEIAGVKYVRFTAASTGSEPAVLLLLLLPDDTEANV